MRLIDADAFIEDIKTEIVNLAMDGMKGTPRSREELYQIIERIGEQPTAYDVEAKVAELEKRANDNDRCADRLSGIESKKKIASWRARAQAFRDSAEIVRGKE